MSNTTQRMYVSRTFGLTFTSSLHFATCAITCAITNRSWTSGFGFVKSKFMLNNKLMYSLKLLYDVKAVTAAFESAKDISTQNSLGTLPPSLTNSFNQNEMEFALWISDNMENIGTSPFTPTEIDSTYK